MTKHVILGYESIGLISDKQAIVLDIGSAYTKCGFASEFCPRCIVPSEEDYCGVTKKLFDKSMTIAQQRSVLKAFLYKIFYKHLLVLPKDRSVVICESILCPSPNRHLLASILFKDYEVPSILFAPAHLLSTFTLGSQDAMIVDVGHSEALVLPIFESVPMLNCWEAAPKGSKSVHENLKDLIFEYCTLRKCDGGCIPIKECPHLVTEHVLQDIMVRACFVTSRERGREIELVLSKGTTEGGPQPVSPVSFPIGNEEFIEIPGIIREAACEIYFTRNNKDEKSIADLILDSLFRCPIDLRKPLAEKLLIVGGGCMVHGFLSRLKSELHSLVAEKYGAKMPIGIFKFYKAPGKPNFNSWIGGSLFGSLEILSHRSLHKEEYLANGKLPDWTNKVDAINDGLENNK